MDGIVLVLSSDGFSLNGSQTFLSPPAAWGRGWRGQVNVNLVDDVLVLAEASLCLLDDIHVVVVVVIVVVVDVGGGGVIRYEKQCHE